MLGGVAERAHAVVHGAGEGNRTLVCSLGSCRSAIELRPRSLDPPDLAETGPSAKRLGTYPPLPTRPYRALILQMRPFAAVLSCPARGQRMTRHGYTILDTGIGRCGIVWGE